MNAKEYLENLNSLYLKIQDDKERVEQLKEEAKKRTGTLTPDKVQSSGSQSKTADKVCEWVALEQQIAEDEAKMQGIVDTIGLLKPYEKTVLYKKYKYDKSLGEISREMNRSYSWVSKMHGVGVKKIQKILDNNENMIKYAKK